jgi:hypothetical protein
MLVPQLAFGKTNNARTPYALCAIDRAKNADISV